MKQRFSSIIVRPITRQRADIQALRAIAVIAVVIYHIWPSRLTGGFMGVDVFFVISGYLMTLTIWKGVKGVGTFKASLSFLIGFYARRIKRLAPAATVLFIAVLVAVYLMGNFSLQLSTTPQVFASATFVQNWFLADQAVDYLGADAGATAVQHFWSLSVEEQFYMIWPLLILIVGLITFAFKSKRAAKQETPALPLVVISAFTLASLIYGIYLTNTNPALAYFVTPARIWELSLGGIIVFLPKIKSHDLRLLLPWAGIALIAYTFVQWGGADFPGIKALLPTLATAVVIWGGSVTQNHDTNINDSNGNTFSFANIARLRPAQFFGDISYSLYLWHWPLIVLVPFYLGVDLDQNNSKLKIALLLASIILATLSYFLVEKPTRSLGTRTPKRRTTASTVRKQYGNSRSVALTWAAGAICLVAVLVPAHNIEARANDYSQNIVIKAFERATDPNDIDFGARATIHQKELGYNPYGLVNREWAQFATTNIYGTLDNPKASYNFSIDTTSSNPIDSYGIFGDTQSNKTLLVIGDSHSAYWYPALDIAAQHLGYKILATSATPAGSSLLYELPDDNGDTFPYYAGGDLSITRNNEHYRWVKDNLWPQADYVIVAMAAYKFPCDDVTPGTPIDAPQRVAKTFLEIEQVTGHKPILIQDSPQQQPIYTEHPEYLNNKDISLKADFEYMNTLQNLLTSIGRGDTFEYLKTESLFVDTNGYSHTQIGGIPVYYDHHHINTLYSASAGEYFTVTLRSML